MTTGIYRTRAFTRPFKTLVMTSSNSWVTSYHSALPKTEASQTTCLHWLTSVSSSPHTYFLTLTSTCSPTHLPINPLQIPSNLPPHRFPRSRPRHSGTHHHLLGRRLARENRRSDCIRRGRILLRGSCARANVITKSENTAGGW
jgi:hypothetical protein